MGGWGFCHGLSYSREQQQMISGQFYATDDFNLNGHHILGWNFLSDIPRGGADDQDVLTWGDGGWTPMAIPATTWGDIESVPDTFTPTAHTHVVSDITDWLTTTVAVSTLHVENNIVLNTTLAEGSRAEPSGIIIYDKVGTQHSFGFYKDTSISGFLCDSTLYVYGALSNQSLYIGGQSSAPWSKLDINGCTLTVTTLPTQFLARKPFKVEGAITTTTTFVGDTIQSSASGTVTVNDDLHIIGDLSLTGSLPISAGTGIAITGNHTISTSLSAGTNIVISNATIATTNAPTFGTVNADKLIVIETTTPSKTNISSQFDVVAGINSNDYVGVESTMSVSCALGFFGDVIPFKSSITLVGAGQYTGAIRLLSGSIDLNNQLIPSSGEVIKLTGTNPATSQQFSEGFFSITVDGGNTGDTIAAFTRARISGAGSAIGYKGYAASIPGGAGTGSIIGVQGFAVRVTGANHSFIAALEGVVTGSDSTPTNKIMGLRTSQHVLHRDGSVFCVTGTDASPGALSPAHVQAGTNTGELYVEGVAEFKDEVFLDGNVAFSITTVTVDYTAADKTVILADATSGTVTITLPAVSGLTGREYMIKKVDSTANKVTIDGNGAETIDGATTQDLNTQYTGFNVVTDGTEWWIIGAE